MTDFPPQHSEEKIHDLQNLQEKSGQNEAVIDRCFLVTEHFHILRHPDYKNAGNGNTVHPVTSLKNPRKALYFFVFLHNK